MKTLQKVVDKLIKWGKTYGLNFNPEKTVVVKFSRKNKLKSSTELIISNKNIPFTHEMRYLGVIIDQKLSWKTQITKTLDICKKNLTIMSALIKRQWGPKPRRAKWLVTGIIRPKLTYASLIWGHSINKKWILEK